MLRRIWIYSELYYPEQAATGYYVTNVAEGLARHFPVHVLCAQPTYLSRGTRAPKLEEHNGVSIRRCAGTTLNKNSLLFRTVNLVTISVSIFFRAVVSLRRDDIVLAVTNPPMLPFLAGLACWLRGARFILRIEDLYPEALVAAGIVREGSPWLGWFDRFQTLLFHHTIRIIALGRDTRDVLVRKYPSAAAKVVVISNWADISQIVPLPRKENQLLSKLQISGKFVVQYSGNMGRTHDIESVVECADMLKDNEGIHFLLIGWGAKELWLRDTVLARGMKNITILSPLPRTEIPVSLNGCDAAIIPLVPGMLGVSVPSRMYNSLAAGKPLIVSAEENSEIARLVNEEKLGWVTAPRSPVLLARAILEASRSPEIMAGMSARARRVVEEKYSPEKVFDQYVELFRRIEKEGR